MSSTHMRPEPATPRPGAKAVETKLEVIVLPVSDVERSKTFYGNLGWRLDGDFNISDDVRGVQMTPPGSPCSIIFGKGITAATPGSVQGLFLIVSDVEAARADLNAHGAQVSDVFHFQGLLNVSDTQARLPGPDPEHGSYRSWASFSDPDGNGWLLQEITTRLPGRGLPLDLATLTDLLREAEEQHGHYEPTAPKHHWSGFYAAYVNAREQGKTQEEAYKAGVLNVEGAR